MDKFDLGRAIRKVFLSAFVILTFAAYALRQQFTGAALNPPAAPELSGFSGGGQISETLTVTPTPTSSPTAPGGAPDGATPTPAPATDTPAPLPSPTSRGGYKDGTYTGPEVDAYYGLVQVQAIVQNGQLASVQFLDYPHDRRTSQRINDQAMPWLQQEAIQAQSANVDIISGATLTSQAFIESLQSALRGATY